MDRRELLRYLLGITGGFVLGLKPKFVSGAPAKLYENTTRPLFCGWVDDIEARKAFVQENKYAYLSQLNKQIEGTGKGQVVLLWKYYERITGSPLVSHYQEIGDCKIAGTKITMADGSRKKIEHIQVGEMVLSHLGQSQKVTRTIRKPYNKHMIRFQAADILEDIVCTPDHLILVNEGQWKPAGTLNLSDKVFIQRYRGPELTKIWDLLDICPDAEVKDDKLRAKHSSKWVNRFIHLDAKLAYIIGAYLAKGGCSRAKGTEWNSGQWCRVDFNLGSKENDFANKIATFIDQIFSIKCSIYSVPSKPTVQYVRCQNKAVAMFFKYLMPGNVYTKKIPTEILTASRDVQLECLLGWLEGDGSCPGRKQRKYDSRRGPNCSGVSVSKSMITDMLRLANYCGFNPKTNKIKVKEGKAQAYIICFNVADTVKLYPEISNKIYPEQKRNLLGLQCKLQSISTISKVATHVYCLDVENDHSFIANSYSVHNCVAHSFGLGTDVLTAVQILMHLKPERWVTKCATELIYAGSRIEVGGGRIRGDGSMGVWAAEFIKDWGILLRLPYLDGAYDFTEYSGAKARQLGRRGQGVPDELEPLCKLHPVKTCSIVRSWEECRDAVANGYPVAMSSSVGFNSTRDRDGFLRRSRRPWYHSMIILGIDDAYRRPGALVQNSWGCVDEQTEILTEYGWKLFKNLKKIEKVATLNRKTHELEYQFPTCYHRYSYDGYLWHHKSRDIDLAVTPNHNLYIAKNSIPTKWFLQQTDECIQTIKMKKDACNLQQDQRIFKIGDFEISMDLWLEFLGYYISEGYTTETQSYFQGVKNGINREVGICQVNEEGRNHIRTCLAKMPFKFHEDRNNFRNHSKELLQELKSFGKAHEKYLPDYIWTCSARQLRILYNALMLGDGSISQGLTGIKRTYYTSSKQLADDFQRLLLHCGFAGDISYIDRRGRNNGTGGITRHIEYRIGIKIKSLEQRIVYNPILLPYQGEVFCVTVPNQVIYIRRNGRAVWTGNSHWVSGPTRHGQPGGSFWVDASIIDAALRQGDSVALSGYVGYPRIKLPDYQIW